MKLSIEFPLRNKHSKLESALRGWVEEEPTGFCNITFQDNNGDTFYYCKIPTPNINEFMIKKHNIDLTNPTIFK